MLIVVRIYSRNAAVVKIEIIILVAPRADAGETTAGVACVFGGAAASELFEYFMRHELCTGRASNKTAICKIAAYKCTELTKSLHPESPAKKHWSC